MAERVRRTRIPLLVISEKLGAQIVGAVEFCGEFTRFVGRALNRTLSPPWRRAQLMEQLWSVGVKSFPIALITALFVGMVMVLQTGVQLIKFGSKSYVPGIAWVVNTREMVPAFVGVVVGARVAAAIAAEVGTMRVTEQIDALELLNVDPLRYLVVPRIIAMTIMLPLICSLSLVGGFFGGMIVAQGALGIDPIAYFTTTRKFAYLQDLYGGLSKTVVFGTIIAVTGSYFGFNTRGGAEGVGRATTNSVVLTLLLILVSDYILTSLILAAFGTPM